MITAAEEQIEHTRLYVAAVLACMDVLDHVEGVTEKEAVSVLGPWLSAIADARLLSANDYMQIGLCQQHRVYAPTNVSKLLTAAAVGQSWCIRGYWTGSRVLINDIAGTLAEAPLTPVSFSQKAGELLPTTSIPHIWLLPVCLSQICVSSASIDDIITKIRYVFTGKLTHKEWESIIHYVMLFVASHKREVRLLRPFGDMPTASWMPISPLQQSRTPARKSATVLWRKLGLLINATDIVFTGDLLPVQAILRRMSNLLAHRDATSAQVYWRNFLAMAAHISMCRGEGSKAAFDIAKQMVVAQAGDLQPVESFNSQPLYTGRLDVDKLVAEIEQSFLETGDSGDIQEGTNDADI